MAWWMEVSLREGREFIHGEDVGEWGKEIILIPLNASASRVSRGLEAVSRGHRERSDTLIERRTMGRTPLEAISP